MLLSWLQAVPARLRDTTRYYVNGLIEDWQRKDVMMASQAIAFKVMVTVVPLIILGTGILGRILVQQDAFATVERVVRDFLPAYQSDALLNFLSALERASGTLTFIGAIALLYTAFTLFSTLRTAIRHVFPTHEERSYAWIRGYLVDLRMVLQVGLLFLLSFGISLALQALNASGEDVLTRIGLDAAWVQTGWHTLLTWLGLLLPLLLSIAMFYQLLFFIPRPRPAKRSALFGSILTATLFEGAKYAFTFYATHVGTFQRYQGSAETDSIAALADTFGLLLTFVFWAYFSSIVLVAGAMVTQLHARRVANRKRSTALVPLATPDPPPTPRTADADQPSLTIEQ